MINQFIDIVKVGNVKALNEFLSNCRSELNLNEKALYVYLLFEYNCGEHYQKLMETFAGAEVKMDELQRSALYKSSKAAEIPEMTEAERDANVQLAFQQAVSGGHSRAVLIILDLDAEKIILDEENVKGLCSLGISCCEKAI